MASQGLRHFVDWEEQFVSHDRGSRVVHYYLKDRHGQNSLAVVGTERSLRHMVYVVCDDFLPLAGLDKSATSAFKWRARREVVEWLQTLLTKTRSASSEQYLSSGSPSTEPAASSEVDAVMEETDEALESGQEERSRGYLERDVRRQVNAGKGDFVWGPSIWRKRLRHFQSFTRNGITISVHDFVYVLTEEERHIAYVEDMYEDRKLKKKLRVRWFHKTNELACKIPPPAPHAREVFYTSFPQVLSVECVDGVATVLCPEHFELGLKMPHMDGATHMHVCSRQFDSNEGIKPFSIQEVKGYWQQQILSHIGVKAPSGLTWSHAEPGSEDLEMDEEEEAEPGNVIRRGPRTARSSRRRVGFSSRMRGGDSGNVSTWVTSPVERACSTSDGAVAAGDTGHVTSISDARPPSTGRVDKMDEGVNSFEHRLEHRLDFKAGDEIEILSQDSGLRGCWFKATITRRVSKRLKVRYDKLQNEDGEGNLEEWVSAWRLAGPDKSGMRVAGRTTVRPFASFNVSPGECKIGQPVDASWNDGWWEGIIINKEPSGDIQVYFPGEGDTASFKTEDLRTSRDWVNDSWIDLLCNPDAVKAAAHLKPETPRIVNEVRTPIAKQQPRALPVPLKVL
ncbi:hypothetical protein M758_8G121300 [Ceratodon purpureus]|uniref:BAH domain-containing protein n=1 Tax=Ceratodon purpureus TaxID=3225 RepID=A0A8T0GZY9_CERPU|nr:hypothetical protein KC19_8G126600 [Ceratodon purpureus]KAG0608636.1 hypothetical protein M758_8G121300 [Ceratodon purpureus]